MTKKSEQQKLQTSAVLLSDTRERERESSFFGWHMTTESLSHSFNDDDDSRAKKTTPRVDDREETKKNQKAASRYIKIEMHCQRVSKSNVLLFEAQRL